MESVRLLVSVAILIGRGLFWVAGLSNMFTAETLPGSENDVLSLVGVENEFIFELAGIRFIFNGLMLHWVEERHKWVEEAALLLTRVTRFKS